jgi:hypothetical protein
MGRIRLLAGIALLALATGMAPVRAQEPAPGLSAAIQAGTCAAAGEVAGQLTVPVVAAGAAAGSGDATRAATSYTAVPLALDALLASPHAILARSGDDTVVACGEVGGAMDPGGALTIGLRPAEGSAYSGIAYLAPVAGDPSQTGISLFLAETVVVPPSVPPTVAPTPTPAPAVEDYPGTVRGQVTLLVGSLHRVDTLFDEPKVDDRAWRDQVTAELALWRLLYRDAQALTPPQEYAAFHEQYLAALALLDGAAEDVRVALDTGDQQRLADGSDKIRQGIEALWALDAPDPAATPAA